MCIHNQCLEQKMKFKMLPISFLFFPTKKLKNNCIVHVISKTDVAPPGLVWDWGERYIVKPENEKRRSVMKVQAFYEEKGLRPFLGVFGYAESKNQCWQAEKWPLHHLICIFPRWPPKIRKTSIAAIGICLGFQTATK